MADLVITPRGTRPDVPTEPALHLGLVFLDLNTRRLYYLNETARQLRAEGLAFTPEDLVQRPLYTADGQLVGRNQLPLIVSLREERPAEATFFWLRTSKQPLCVRWATAPLKDSEDQLLGISGSICCTLPEPDWQGIVGLAHDLRTPLNAVEERARALRQSGLSGALLQEHLEILQSSAERALGVSGQVLDWCRAPALRGRKMEPSWFALQPFLGSLVQEQRAAAERSGLTLVTDLKAADGWAVHTDRVRFGRLISNLIGNAIRSAGSGTVALTASYRHEPTGKLLVLGIMNTALGISPEEQESIFHSFEPPEVSLEADSADSGVQAAVIDRLARELEIDVDVYGESRRESALCLVLPWRMLQPVSDSATDQLAVSDAAAEPEKNAS